MAAHVTPTLDKAVATLMRAVGRDVVMARFRRLGDGDVAEKAPGDLVTVADRESEARLTEGLTAILADARVIGEEACAADPSLLDGIGEGLAWIVDPIDGTGNYAAGHAPFAVMVALVADGGTLGGWILDPVAGRLLSAAAGGGAFSNGERVRARGSGASRPVAALALEYLPPGMARDLGARAAGRLTPADPPRCAGEQYPRVMLGQNDAALFHRVLPWDHAAGALILTEAGGRVAQFDGTDYRVDLPRRLMLAASTPALWDEIRAVLAA